LFDPESGIGFSVSQTHFFDSLMTNIWVKRALILNVLAQKNSFTCPKQNYLQFHDICGYIKWKDKSIFLSPLLVLLLDPGLGRPDPGSVMDKNQDPG
jgi:hypothetical protein